MTNGGNFWQLCSACGGPFPECHNSYPAGGCLLPLETRSTLLWPWVTRRKEKKACLELVGRKTLSISLRSDFSPLPLLPLLFYLSSPPPFLSSCLNLWYRLSPCWWQTRSKIFPVCPGKCLHVSMLYRETTKKILLTVPLAESWSCFSAKFLWTIRTFIPVGLFRR